MVRTGMLFIMVLVALSACTSREDADQMLLEACKAGIQVTLPSGRQVTGLVSHTFDEVNKLRDGYRVLNVQYTTTGRSYARPAKCIFKEDSLPQGIFYKARLYQLYADGDFWGEQGGRHKPSDQDYERLRAATDPILNKK
ncbi:MAG: hypothetical protein IT558_06015 [Alphaproteobacteria bacterium]|nr:hypothetical protein [Alphaproteobacteria bacterium]